MKKTIIILLTAGLAPSIFAKKKIDKKEYSQLVQQCQAIAIKIRQEQNFEVIRQDALKNHQQIMAGLAERFCGPGQHLNAFGGDSEQLKNNLEILRINHERQVNALVTQAISVYLQVVGSPAALGLLNDLIKMSFHV